MFCEGEIVTGCPVRIRALPDLSQIMFSGIDPCALGSIVEVLVCYENIGNNINPTAISFSVVFRLI